MPVTGVQQFPQPPDNRSAVDPKMIQSPTAMEQAFNPNGLQAAAARGSNVYMGGLPYAPGAGRPRNATLNFGDSSAPGFQAALQRRLQEYGNAAKDRQRSNRGPTGPR